MLVTFRVLFTKEDLGRLANTRRTQGLPLWSRKLSWIRGLTRGAGGLWEVDKHPRGDSSSGERGGAQALGFRLRFRHLPAADLG